MLLDRMLLPVLPARRRAALLVALLALPIAPRWARAQASNPGAVPAGEPARFLQRYIGLTPAEIEKARGGAVVTKVLKSQKTDEVAVFGIVSVDAPRADVVRKVRDLPTFLRTTGRAAFALFATPATAGDVRGFTLEQNAFEAIKACRPGDCDVKLPTANIEEFRRAVDWSAPDAKAQVENLVRQRAAGYVNAYRKGGAAAMVQYGDQKAERAASAVFDELLADSPYLLEYLPAFHKYLQAYPNGNLPGAVDAIFWATDRMPSLRPILSINHVTLYTPPTAPFALMSVKQLYASHYFVGAFTFTTMLDRPDAPGGPGTWYIVVQRSRFDNLPSGGLLNIRGRVIGRMQDAMRAELAQRKAALEGRRQVGG